MQKTATGVAVFSLWHGGAAKWADRDIRPYAKQENFNEKCHSEERSDVGIRSPLCDTVCGGYGCPCCGAQNFRAALRRPLKILTAATRSSRFLCHRQRSIRSPHQSADWFAMTGFEKEVRGRAGRCGYRPLRRAWGAVRDERRGVVTPPYGCVIKCL